MSEKEKNRKRSEMSKQDTCKAADGHKMRPSCTREDADEYAYTYPGCPWWSSWFPMENFAELPCDATYKYRTSKPASQEVTSMKELEKERDGWKEYASNLELQSRIAKLETQLSCAKTEFSQLQEERDGYKRERDEWKDAYAVYIDISNMAQEKLEKELEECKKQKEARLKKLSASRAAVSALNMQCEEMHQELAALKPLWPYVHAAQQIAQMLGDPDLWDKDRWEFLCGDPVFGEDFFCNGWSRLGEDMDGDIVDVIIRRPKVQYILREHITSKLIQHLGVLKCDMARYSSTELAHSWLPERTLCEVRIHETNPYRSWDWDGESRWANCRITTDTISKAYERLSEDAKARALEALPWLKEYVG